MEPHATPPDIRSDRVMVRRLAWLLALTATAVFLPALACGFVDWDDPAYVCDNPLVAGGLSPAGVRAACTRVIFGFWAPLTILSYQADVAAHGLDPRGFHLTNVLLHAVSTGLLYGSLASLTGSRWRSAAVVLLWAVHPLRVESVVWIAERKDVLSMACVTAALSAYASYCRRPTARGLTLVFGAMLAGCLAKPSVITLPVLLLLLDIWPLRRLTASSPTRPADAALRRGDVAAERSISQAIPRALARSVPLPILEKLPLLFLSATFTFVTLQTHSAALDPGPAALPQGVRLRTAIGGVIWYLDHTVRPIGLHPLHHHFEPPPGPLAVGTAVAIVAILVLLAVWRPASRLAIGVGIAWFVLSLLPSLGLLGRVGVAPYADRFTYLPHIGLFLAIIWAVAPTGPTASQPAWRSPALIVAAAFLTVLTTVSIAVTESQIRIWQDSSALFGHALDVDHGNFLARYQYGETLRRRGDSSAAAGHFGESLRSMERLGVGALKRAVVCQALGVALRDSGHPQEAAAAFRQALELDSTNLAAAKNLGLLLLSAGDVAAARELLAAVAERHPGDAETVEMLVVANARLGRLQDALEACRRLVKLAPDSATPRSRLGQLLLAAGDPRAALGEFELAAGLDPEHPGIGDLIDRARAASADH